MNAIDFKIQTLCDISFFNEEGDALFSSNKSLNLPASIELDGRLNLTDDSKKMLQGTSQEKFVTYFLNVISDLETWVKEEYYVSWEEDDVNFLNFMLRSKYIYSAKIEGAYINILRELFLRCLTPFILKSKKDDIFFDDLSYWFITIGEKLYKKYSLLPSLEKIIAHFEKEHLAICK